MAANEEKSQKNKNILLLVVLVPVLVIIGIVAGYYILPTAGQVEETSAEEGRLEEEVVVPLDEFLVNLNPSSDQNNYVRMEIALGTHHERGKEIIPANLAKIRDTVIYTTTRQTRDTLFDESGRLVLKDKLTDEINKALELEVIESIYVTEFIVQ